jgi:hypothetical protein
LTDTPTAQELVISRIGLELEHMIGSVGGATKEDCPGASEAAVCDSLEGDCPDPDNDSEPPETGDPGLAISLAEQIDRKSQVE